MPSSAKSSGSNSFSPGLQDDQALLIYLQQDRSKPPGRIFYELAREKILFVELANGEPQAGVIDTFTLAFATFLDDLRQTKSVGLPCPRIWEHFIKYYQAAASKKLSATQLEELHTPYFARDVLLQAIVEDKDKVFTALNEAYRAPAQQMVRQRFKNAPVSFDDAYQEALINLIKNPPAPNKAHTAQLYSIFRTILYRRILDQLNRSQPDDEMLKSIFPEEESHNPADYTDYIVEDQGLDKRFASDDAGEILGKALQQLSATCRDLLHQRFFAGLKFREIAAKNGYHTNDVGSKISRCLKKLRQILTPPKRPE